MGTIALTIKRKGSIRGGVEGGGAVQGSEKKKEKNEKVWENWCERSEGVAEGPSGSLGFCVIARLRAQHTCMLWLGALKASQCAQSVCMYGGSQCARKLTGGEEKKWQGQNVIELVSKWEKEKGKREAN